jgi:hypothetical protein
LDTVERVVRFIGAVFAASIATGPLFCFSVVLIDVSSGRAGLGETLLSLVIESIPVGAFFGFLPNLIGTTLMTTLGARFRPARSAFAWVGAGALGGLLLVILYAGLGLSDWTFLAAMVLTGMACAGICRAFTRWPGPAEDPQA